MRARATRAAILFALVGLSCQERNRPECNGLISRESHTNREVGHFIGSIGDVGIAVASDPICDSNQEDETYLFLTRLRGSDDYIANIRGTKWDRCQSLHKGLSREKHITELRGVEAQYVFERSFSVREWFAFNGDGVCLDVNARRWAVANILYGHGSRDHYLVAQNLSGENEFRLFNGEPCTAAGNHGLSSNFVGFPSTDPLLFGDFFGVPKLIFASQPQPAGGPPQQDCGAGKNDCEKSRDRAFVVIKEFADMKERDKRHVISGAIFVGGILCFAAILGILWMKRQ